MKKILLACVTSQNVITFRRGLITALKAEGYDVSVVAFDREYETEIKELDVAFYCIEDSNRSLNPLRILSLKGRYKTLIKSILPDTVFTFMLKPNIFATLAAHSAGVKRIFGMVEGAGDVFINTGFKWNIIRSVVCFLYKRAFKHSNKVFFLNTDDREEFISRGLVTAEQTELIRGIGVDLEHFAYVPLKNHNTFLMVARMLRTKGVLDYCECARRVKKLHPEAVFNYLGAEGNVTVSDIQEYIDDGSINYLGITKDVRPYYADSTFLVLPSYREGCPVSVMEASAIGRGIITTNAPGCRQSISDGYNGYIVKVGDIQALVEKCIFVLEDPTKAEEICKNSRKFAEDNFEQSGVNKAVISLFS